MTVKDIYSHQAFESLNADYSSFLIDVRTEQEWNYVGIPLIASPLHYIQLSWRLEPDMHKNNSFTVELMKIIKDKNSMLFFLCRSGVRSLEAALNIYNEGYINCYNIVDGFEGSGKNCGWKNNKLPFTIKDIKYAL